MTYAEKLKDPRWQKKRLDILSRDNWICLLCEEPGKTLHVHHRVYEYGKDPWDYEDGNFDTLCVECHEYEEGFRVSVREKINQLYSKGVPGQQIWCALHDAFDK